MKETWARPPSCIAVIGVGYVGLPLAVAFARHLPTLGFDRNPRRVEELQRGFDRNGEVPQETLRQPNLRFTADPEEIPRADLFIVAVSTPVDRAKRPDLTPLVEASRLVGKALKARLQIRGPYAPRPVVVYESTVYPGCTEEVCVPVLEDASELKAGEDFKVGYSPERINPGDQEHTLEKVVKIVAGQDSETTELLASLYGLVVKAGIYKAPDIRTAEAAKVVENVQRDVNIALMNEVSILFHRLGLDTHEVLKAARTKWNFIPFTPGLVGGHCIPEDPYYLAHKAQEVGYYPELILAGRRINERMGFYVGRETVRLLIRTGRAVKGARVLVLGFAFKENVRDVRNTRVLDLVRELQEHGCEVEVYDPQVLHKDSLTPGVPFLNENPFQNRRGVYDAVVLAVPHRAFLEYSWEDVQGLLRSGVIGIMVDVKGVYADVVCRSDPQLLYWTL